jgi:uncharacterized small protein (DUF1192 family)
MKYAAPVLLVLLGTASCSPVEKVVKLLEDLQSQIEADGKAESLTYNKFACWCEKTATRKASMITVGSDGLRSLGQQILKLKAEVATLTSEITELKTKIKENEENQESLTAIRTKENTKYSSDSTESKETLAALAQAIKILVQATKPGAEKADALLQEDSTMQAQNAVRTALAALPTSATISPAHVTLLGEFTKMKHGAKYAPQSATIQGILSDMYSTISTDLESTTMEEATKNTNFEKVIASMQQEVIDMSASLEDKEKKKAAAESLLADTTESYDDTEKQYKADTFFFDATKESCEAKAAEWTTRSELRAEELEGLKKALEILTSDEARELFSRSIVAGYGTGTNNTKSFLQVEMKDSNSPTSKAYAALRLEARKTHSLRLASLAATVRMAKAGHFEKVIKAIDDMINTLKVEGADDLKKKEQCLTQYQDINVKVGDLSWKIQKNQAAIDKLTSLIEMQTAEKTQTEEDIKDVDQQMADMEKTRIAENKEFLLARKDDQNAIGLLEEAKAAITSYFTNHSISMVQQDPVFAVSEDQAPEAKFSSKGKHKTASKGIVALLDMIIEDLQNELSDGVHNEVSAQTDYEKSVAASTKLREELVAKKVNLETAIAKHKTEKSEEEEDMQTNTVDKDAELKYKAEIKPDCDWIIKSFKERATAREAEMNGLLGAKEYLVGKAPEALIEQKITFDDDVLPGVKFLGLK